jgi:hypothetical protein
MGSLLGVGDEVAAGRSNGLSEADRAGARPMTMANAAGRTRSVVSVAAASPPTTARPSGAVWSPPSPRPTAIGTMPATIARLVIRIGRTRPLAPSTPASSAGTPPARALSAKVTRRMAFAVATPTAMIAPMNDCKLSVEP